MDSQALLADYAGNGSEEAFRELVVRYTDLVYSTAFRLVWGDAHLAEDVTQMVFVDLARQARKLPREVLLGGWLHRDTCFVAAKAMRAQRRRQAREQEAAQMKMLDDHSEAAAAQLGPILDEAINQLGDADRTAILLRFFERRDFRAIGQALGTSDDTAQKRLSRALEKLHGLLAGCGVTFSAAALGTVLTTQAVTAAPAGLAFTVSAAALASTTGGASAALTFLKVMAMTKFKLGLLGALVIAGVAVPVLLHEMSSRTSIEKQPAAPQAAPAAGASEGVKADANPAAAVLAGPPRAAGPSLPTVPEPDRTSFRAVDEILKGQRLSAEAAQELEAKLAREPEDIAARCQLLGYYSSRQYASKPAREARQAHVLWFIQNHPELSLSGYAGLDRQLDGPAVYDQAKALWLQQVDNNPQNCTLLGNAAEFCLLQDRPTAEALLKQAQALESANPAWSERLAHLYGLDAQSGLPAAAKALQQMESAQASTTGEMQRFFNLNSLAQMAFDAGELDKAQTHAAELLQQAAHPQSGWTYGDAVYRGNLVLGRIALRQGRLDQAKQYLAAAGRTTGSPVLGSFGPNMSLAKELLEQGEKETVLEFFKLCGGFWKDDKLATWAQQINQGAMPDFGANLNY